MFRLRKQKTNEKDWMQTHTCFSLNCFYLWLRYSSGMKSVWNFMTLDPMYAPAIYSIYKVIVDDEYDNYEIVAFIPR